MQFLDIVDGGCGVQPQDSIAPFLDRLVINRAFILLRLSFGREVPENGIDPVAGFCCQRLDVRIGPVHLEFQALLLAQAQEDKIGWPDPALIVEQTKIGHDIKHVDKELDASFREEPVKLRRIDIVITDLVVRCCRQPLLMENPGHLQDERRLETRIQIGIGDGHVPFGDHGLGVLQRGVFTELVVLHIADDVPEEVRTVVVDMVGDEIQWRLAARAVGNQRVADRIAGIGQCGAAHFGVWIRLANRVGGVLVVDEEILGSE